MQGMDPPTRVFRVSATVAPTATGFGRRRGSASAPQWSFAAHPRHAGQHDVVVEDSEAERLTAGELDVARVSAPAAAAFDNRLSAAAGEGPLDGVQAHGARQRCLDQRWRVGRVKAGTLHRRCPGNQTAAEPSRRGSARTPDRGDCSPDAVTGAPLRCHSGSMELSAERRVVEVNALEAFADLLFALDSDEPATAFYARLCEATCQLAAMDRAVIFLYDEALRRVRSVGSHGMELSQFEDVHVTLEDAPIAKRALSEDSVVEVTGDFAEHLPPEHVGFLRDTRLVCTPMVAAGRWPGVILSDRADDRPLTSAERHLLWTLGKVAALAASARVATREHERARALQDRIDLAREIHDGVIQRLFGVSMALSISEELPVEERRRCAEEIQDALADLRAAVQRPLGRPSEPRPTTLVDEVSRLRHEHPQLVVELEAEPDLRVPARLEPLAQSVVAEALRNALKHAKPTRVLVRIHDRDGALIVDVVNDGVETATVRRTAMGLRLAAFEALQQGGVIEFGQTDTTEWRVRLLVPAQEAQS